MGKRAVLTLGRYGDICNALPIAYKIWKDTGEKPGFIIAKAYADILDGVSYVEPVVFHGEFRHVGAAFDQFRSQFRHIHIAQCYGSNWIPRHHSFCLDAWAQAGYEKFFGLVPLVFDQRNEQREQDLLFNHAVGSHKVILVNFLGHSSPLQASGVILESIQRAWAWKATIVNLAQIRAYRFYDVLGLIDAADLLITSDTATLHLAQASKTPSIQFIVETPTPWHGSIAKGRCVLQVNYSRVVKRLSEVHAVIAENVL